MSNGSGIFKECKFCPRCGVTALEKDNYAKEIGQSRKEKHEWVCLACGFGFRLIPSIRHMHAKTLIRQHSQLRPVNQD